MGFDTYGATATTLSDTIAATADPTVVDTEDTTMGNCCSHYNTCSPQPSDVTINVTEIRIAESVVGWRQEQVTIVANVGTLTYTPVTDYNLLIFAGGVQQRNPTDYIRSGKTITFVDALPVGASVTAYYLSVETGGVPVGIETAGVIVAWSSTLAIPTGWLECDGSAVSRTTYVDLFGAIGTTYGVGDGSSTFNLPDFEQSFYDPVSGALVTLTAIIKY